MFCTWEDKTLENNWQANLPEYDTTTVVFRVVKGADFVDAFLIFLYAVLLNVGCNEIDNLPIAKIQCGKNYTDKEEFHRLCA